MSTRADGAQIIRWWESGRRRTRVRWTSYEEACRILDAIMAELAERGAVGGAHTLVSYGERFMARQKRGNRSTFRASWSRWECHVSQAPFADAPIQNITSPAVARWVAQLVASGMKPRSVRHCVYLLSAILRDAAEHGIIADNPVRNVRKPEVGETRREVILTAEQIELLAVSDKVTDEPMRCVALAYVGTGLRPGELLGLRTEDVRSDHIMVLRSGRTTSTTKTGNKRRVELFGVGAYAVGRWMKVMRPSLKVRGWRPKSSPWAFPIPDRWLRTDGRLGAVLDAIGAHGLTAHDLRGTCATHLLSGTWGEPWTIAEVAAHIGDSIQTTEKSYAHLVAGVTRRKADKTGSGWDLKLFSGVPANAVNDVSGAVGHEGLEPSANGLRGIGPSLSDREVARLRSLEDPELAAAYLEAAADGEHELARAVALLMAERESRDTDAVRAGGPGWARAANRIARRLRASETEGTKENTSGTR